MYNFHQFFMTSLYLIVLKDIFLVTYNLTLYINNLEPICHLKELLNGLIKQVCFLLYFKEGRDKFCKAIQYACRFLKYHY
jgi:hypothetical protein